MKTNTSICLICPTFTSLKQEVIPDLCEIWSPSQNQQLHCAVSPLNWYYLIFTNQIKSTLIDNVAMYYEQNSRSQSQHLQTFKFTTFPLWLNILKSYSQKIKDSNSLFTCEHVVWKWNLFCTMQGKQFWFL